MLETYHNRLHACLHIKGERGPAGVRGSKGGKASNGSTGLPGEKVSIGLVISFSCFADLTFRVCVGCRA